MAINLPGMQAGFFFDKPEAAVVRVKMRATFDASLALEDDPMLSMAVFYDLELAGSVHIAPAGGISWEATDVARADVSPIAVADSPFELELVWGPSGAVLLINGGAPIALTTQSAPPASGIVEFTISAGGGGGGGGPLGVVDWFDVNIAEAFTPAFWTAFRNTFEVA